MNYLKKSRKFRKYDSLDDVLRISYRVKKFFGLTVFELAIDSEQGLVSKFSPIGLVLFTSVIITYYYSTYKMFSGDQTILRELYSTRLQHYGDVLERILSSIFAAFVFYKLPFHISLSTGYIKKLLDVDMNIENMGFKIDHSISARKMLKSSFGQVTVGLARLLSVWITLKYLKLPTLAEILIQVSTTNMLALVLTSHYCNYIIILRDRYEIINGMLNEIKDRKSWEQKVFVRSRQCVVQKTLQYQDKIICEKIKRCARTYGMLFGAAQACQDMYGFSLAYTFLFCLIYIILYLFYFMEATAGGLFYDTQRYIYFLIYVFWQIVYAGGVIIFNIYFSDAAVSEAQRTSTVVHEIINSDIGESVSAQAMQFSLQISHQIPVFTAYGLCKVDYTLLLQGAYNVTTFLVILLQFVMD